MVNNGGGGGFKYLHCKVQTLSIDFQHTSLNTFVNRVLQFTMCGLFGVAMGMGNEDKRDGMGTNGVWVLSHPMSIFTTHIQRC